MNSGYIKFWRKAQDSASWNRGLMYQGLIINLLSRAAWKNGSYHGVNILPGQFGAVMSHLAESLGVPRSTLQRMVAHLEDDGFLKVENMGNRFVLITIVNWSIYQGYEEEVGQPMGNRRLTNGQPMGNPSIRKEEVKKEEEIINIPPYPPMGDVELSEKPVSKTTSGKKKGNQTGNSLSELKAAMAAYTQDESLLGALEDFRLMRERIRKPMTGRALNLLFRELDSLASGDTPLKVSILEQSILNSWQSIYALKDQARASPGLSRYGGVLPTGDQRIYQQPKEDEIPTWMQEATNGTTSTKRSCVNG